MSIPGQAQTCFGPGQASFALYLEVEAGDMELPEVSYLGTP